MATVKQLEQMVSYLNQITKQPEKSFENGKWNIGNFHISHDIGGFGLIQVANEFGGVRSFLNGYHVNRKEFEARLNSFIQGIEWKGKGS
jgi:hypothetical protein